MKILDEGLSCTTAPALQASFQKRSSEKSVRAMIEFISEGSFGLTESDVDLESFECLSYVIYSVHSRQIKIRDKANGKIVASIQTYERLHDARTYKN